MNIVRRLRERHHGAAVEAEFWDRVHARNPGRALPVRLPLARRCRWPLILAGAVVVAGMGWLLPARMFVPVALALVGVAATVPTWGKLP